MFKQSQCLLTSRAAELAWVRILKYAAKENVYVTVSPPNSAFGWFVTLVDPWGNTVYFREHDDTNTFDAAVRLTDKLIKKYCDNGL